MVLLDAVSDAAHDHVYLHQDVPLSETLSHANFWNQVVSWANVRLRVLGGSRAVISPRAGQQRRERAPIRPRITGFDGHPGKNVDVVGDAHRLSAYFLVDEPFDLIVSLPCWSTWPCPGSRPKWPNASTGGYLALETHFSFSSHEMALALLSVQRHGFAGVVLPGPGLECLEGPVLNPSWAVFPPWPTPICAAGPSPGFTRHSEIRSRKTHDVPDFDWSRLTPADLVGPCAIPDPSPRTEPQPPVQEADAGRGFRTVRHANSQYVFNYLESSIRASSWRFSLRGIGQGRQNGKMAGVGWESAVSSARSSKP